MKAKGLNIRKLGRKEYEKRWHYRHKLYVLAYYSRGKIQCACCGEAQLEFLTIDHIAGGGNKHRKAIGKNGAQFRKWLIDNQFPDGYQVLCMNCNWAKGKYGKCPHTNKI